MNFYPCLSYYTDCVLTYPINYNPLGKPQKRSSLFSGPATKALSPPSVASLRDYMLGDL